MYFNIFRYQKINMKKKNKINVKQKKRLLNGILKAEITMLIKVIKKKLLNFIKRVQKQILIMQMHTLVWQAAKKLLNNLSNQ